MNSPPLGRTRLRWIGHPLLALAAIGVWASIAFGAGSVTSEGNPHNGSDSYYGGTTDPTGNGNGNGGGNAPGNPATLGIAGTPAGFEIDGNLLASLGGSDWFPGSGSGIIDPVTCTVYPLQAPAFFGRDHEWRQDIDGKFKTRSNKNDDDISASVKPWHWSTLGGNPQKNDITELYAHARQDGQGKTWIFVGISTRAPQGDNHTDVEFNQAGLTITGETDGQIIGNGPHNGRTIGDPLVVVDEVVGGRDPVPTLRRWNGTEFVIVPQSEWDGKYFAVHNVVQTAAPCGAVNRKGDMTNAYEPMQFIELALRSDLTLNPDFAMCGNEPTVMVKTRSSHSFTSELKDFALASLTSPDAPVCSITGPETICAGGTATLCGPEGDGYTYLWSTGETTRCISVSSQATYSLTVTGYPCGPVTCEKTLLASSAPVCDITGPDTICDGQTAVLCAPEGFQGTQFTYLWSTGETTRCITIDQPGDYTVTVSTPECGSATCTKTVTTGTSELACAIEGPTDIDPDSTAILCGPEGDDLTYDWSTGETTRCITIDGPGEYTLTVDSPSCGTSTCTRVVTDRPTSSCRCTIGYPDDSNLPRSAQAFVETSILKAVVPGRDGCPIGEQVLKLWYSDDTALAMGIRRVVVYTSPTDSTVTDYPVTPYPGAPACVDAPDYGATAMTGDQTGNDTAVDGGRPIWPALFMTDITLDKDARDGDWQQGATIAIPADRVCGTWTTGVRRVLAYDGNQTLVTMDPSPAANGWDLGLGSDSPPGGFGAYTDEGYGAQVMWDLSTLNLVAGRRYRLYTMIHEGSQSSPNGGNVGHGCTRVRVSQLGTVMADDGAETGFSALREESELSSLSTVSPARFELAQNAPNPFSAGSHTLIRFALPQKSQVRLAVYTIAGQRVGTLADGVFDAGEQAIDWNGTGANGRTLAPGMYVCKLEASAPGTGRVVQMKKMLIVK